MTLSSLIQETVGEHEGDGDSFWTHSHSSSSVDPLGGSDDVTVSSTLSSPSDPFIGEYVAYAVSL